MNSYPDTFLSMAPGINEFAVLLPDAGPAELENRLLHAIQAVAVQPGVTVSIGGTQFRRKVPPASMMESVDKALYAAKRKGKNKIVIG